MTASAPVFRSLCQLTGERADGPSAFFRALDGLNSRDEQVCDEAELAADSWDHDEWWLS